ncbi:MAG TPA: acyl-CoA dehydrogenase [Ferruginibacter sp.]|nr:acyl-CoA dehydrogenase [Ferruginibacter sp.]HMP22082.1 acyl-CoA dehydrogenase [Ferruginibacter sp.]
MNDAFQNSQHPSATIPDAIVTAIRSRAAEAEKLQQLHPDQLDIIYRQKWLSIFVPQQYNGLQLTLPDALQLEEALAWCDGALGWTVTLCAGAGWFAGFLAPEIASSVFEDSKACLAGSGRAGGIAKIIEGGYEITGNWDYASGAFCATAFTANCTIEQNGALLKNADGSMQVKAFIFLRDEVTVQPTWKTMGMIATGSNSFSVEKLIVPASRAFSIDTTGIILQHPVYYFPFLQLAETTLAVNSSGMAIRFLDLCRPLLLRHKNNAVINMLNTAAAQLQKIRDLFYKLVLQCWQECCMHFSVSGTLLQELSVIAHKLAITARSLVDTLYPYCGMEAANPATEINRVWRNLHTASQHSLFNVAVNTSAMP